MAVASENGPLGRIARLGNNTIDQCTQHRHGTGNAPGTALGPPKFASFL